MIEHFKPRASLEVQFSTSITKVSRKSYQISPYFLLSWKPDHPLMLLWSFLFKRFVNKKTLNWLCFRRFALSQTFVYFSDFTNYWLIRKLAFFNKYVRLQENCHYVQQLLLWCCPSKSSIFSHTEKRRTFDLWQETRNIVTKRQLILIICHNCVHPRVNKNGGKTYPKSTVSLTPHKHFSQIFSYFSYFGRFL